MLRRMPPIWAVAACYNIAAPSMKGFLSCPILRLGKQNIWSSVTCLNRRRWPFESKIVSISQVTSHGMRITRTFSASLTH
ncbi:hypothetical protein L211DRAFT_146601 [Terfezia boudieri ATCC MYA-4762]|uniref:Uncharacterized protein n=1 Tax=Terfezia boudieri ATCC MYA-4762 TaxID=1051890 RepID=A0A3N4LPC9_9PEZI|nr:hypothetical protein L211DRAFT_146601 [Terfezia boudieri ATCC MYA-4762]